jgi:hypothetical protein
MFAGSSFTLSRVAQVDAFAVDTLSRVAKMHEFAVDTLSRVAKMHELAVDTPSRVAKMHELAVDTPSRVAKMHELARTILHFDLLPRSIAATKAATNPAIHTPAPPTRNFGIVVIRVAF